MRKLFLLLVFFSLFSLVGSGVFAALKIADLPNGTFDITYNEQLKADGGKEPYSFIKSGGTLPPGLNISLDGKGVISGTPRKEGAGKKAEFEITVVDANNQTESETLSIFIDIPDLKITNPTGDTLPEGTVGEPYKEFTFRAEGGIPPYTWTNPSGYLAKPLGLQLSSNGKITGVPLKAGSFSTNIKVTGDLITEKYIAPQLWIKINSKPFEIITGSLSPGEVNNSSYTATLSAHGGTPPYSWSFLDGSYPPGLNQITTNSLFQGIIGGTPKKEGTFTFRVLVRDADGTKLSKQFSILIEKSCQCADGTSCGACNAGSPPLYCDGTTKTLVENDLCQSGGTGGTGGTGGAIKTKDELEVGWPNSPMGTSLTINSSLTDLIKYFYEWGIALGGFAAFIALVIAGFQYLTSAGDAGRMKDAMDRIKSAGLGLVLLLSSFLVLNTINPQLTKLEMPPIPSGGGGLDSIEAEKVTTSSNDCEGATLYAGTNYNEPYDTPVISLGKNPFPSKREIGSVKIKGSCQLILSKLPDCNVSPENTSPPINSDAPNVGLYSGGAIEFKCALLNETPFNLDTK